MKESEKCIIYERVRELEKQEPDLEEILSRIGVHINTQFIKELRVEKESKK